MKSILTVAIGDRIYLGTHPFTVTDKGNLGLDVLPARYDPNTEWLKGRFMTWAELEKRNARLVRKA